MSAQSRDTLQGLAGRPSVQDSLGGFREQYGRHASREIAARYGVSQRTAQRALRGETRAPKFTESPQYQADQSAAAGRRAAAAVRGISTVHAGHVSVEYDGRDEGIRDIGDVFLSPADLDEIAGYLENEDWDQAGDALDAAILDQYGGLGSALTIEDFRDGLSFD